MLFNTGQKISDELSDYLKEFTNQAERAIVAIKFDYGPGTLNAIVLQTRAVTSKNSELVTELMKVAISNRNKKKYRLDNIHDKILNEVKS